jgi:S1-C subfamily serine protease
MGTVSWTSDYAYPRIPARPDIAPRPDSRSRGDVPSWALDEWLAEPLRDRPTEFLPPPHEPRRRGRSILAAVLAVLLLIGSGIGIGWTLGSGDNSASAPRTPEPPLSTTNPPASPARDLTVKEVAARVTSAIVDINTVIGAVGGRRALGQAAGTGMVLTATGEVLTNNHVIAGATTIRVVVQHRGEFEATVIGADPVDDVALLQMTNASNLPTVSLGDPSRLSIGDTVVAVGNALGRGGAPSVTQGSVQALGRSVDVRDEHGGFEHLHDLIQMDAPISRGDSGGAVVNTRAQIVGMITAARTGPNRPVSHLGYAISVSDALHIVNEIRAGHRSSTIILGKPAFLGVEVEAFSASRAAGAGLGVSSGAWVAAVIPGAPAARAGMRAPTVITAIDGETISSTDDLGPAIYTHRPGERIAVTWVDRSGTHTATVVLIAGPAV